MTDLDRAADMECRADLYRTGAADLRNAGQPGSALVMERRADRLVTAARALCPRPTRTVRAIAA